MSQKQRDQAHTDVDPQAPVRAWTDPSQARHATKAALAQPDPDAPEPIEGRSMRSGSNYKPVEHPKGKLERTATGKPKVWKAPFWKRRKLNRLEKARYADALARADS